MNAISADIFDKQGDNFLNCLNSDYVTVGVSMFLILYAVFIAPILTNKILRFFENWIVQIALFFAIIYINTKNSTLALSVALAVVVTLIVASNRSGYRCVAKSGSKKEQFHGYSSDDHESPADYDDSDDANVDAIIDNDIIDNDIIDNDVDSDEKEMTRQEMLNNQEDIGRKIPILPESEVQGVIADHIEENDKNYAGATHMIIDGPVTSNTKPYVPAEQEDSSVSESEDGQEMRMKLMSGVEESSMNDSSSGCSLDETQNMGEEYANIKHVDNINKTSAESAEEAMKLSVDKVASEIEEITGVTFPEEVKSEVLEEVKEKVTVIAGKGMKLNEYDVTMICRDAYGRRY